MYPNNYNSTTKLYRETSPKGNDYGVVPTKYYYLPSNTVPFQRTQFPIRVATMPLEYMDSSQVLYSAAPIQHALKKNKAKIKSMKKQMKEMKERLICCQKEIKSSNEDNLYLKKALISVMSTGNLSREENYSKNNPASNQYFNQTSSQKSGLSRSKENIDISSSNLQEKKKLLIPSMFKELENQNNFTLSLSKEQKSSMPLSQTKQRTRFQILENQSGCFASPRESKKQYKENKDFVLEKSVKTKQKIETQGLRKKKIMSIKDKEETKKTIQINKKKVTLFKKEPSFSKISQQMLLSIVDADKESENPSKISARFNVVDKTNEKCMGKTISPVSFKRNLLTINGRGSSHLPDESLIQQNNVSSSRDSDLRNRLDIQSDIILEISTMKSLDK